MVVGRASPLDLRGQGRGDGGGRGGGQAGVPPPGGCLAVEHPQLLIHAVVLS